MPIKIVLVEDSDTVQIAAKMIMQSEREYEIQCLKSLREFQSIGAQPDLLIIDHSLSDNLSLETLHSKPLIFLVGPKSTMPAPGPFKASVLKKPFDSQSLLRAIQSALAVEQKPPVRPTLPLPPMDHLRAPYPVTQGKAPDVQPAASLAPHVESQNLGMSQEELRAIARKIIEEIAWEVVPELAESIIREEIRRLTKE